MATAQSLRKRVREELQHEIMARARDRLREDGVDGLTLRGIARDLQMAPSAVHRYFTTRDDLLAALISDAFDAAADVVEAADAVMPRDEYLARWLETTAALRRWALAHPHEYTLIYGSPIPGFVAPGSTAVPAARDKAVFGRILSDAFGAGRVHLPKPTARLGDRTAEDAGRLRAAVLPGVPDHVVRAAVTAWSGLFGMLSMELFGHFEHMIEDRDTQFDSAMRALATVMGMEA